MRCGKFLCMSDSVAGEQSCDDRAPQTLFFAMFGLAVAMGGSMRSPASSCPTYTVSSNSAEVASHSVFSFANEDLFFSKSSD